MKKKYSKKDIAVNIQQFVLPYLYRLKRKSTPRDQKDIDLLEKKLKAVTSNFGIKISYPKWKLTSREIEVCEMIKNGLGTKDIADVLCASVKTIEHHRNHIRKKLGISKQRVDLHAFLKGFS